MTILQKLTLVVELIFFLPLAANAHFI